jgi:hypothetical protein
MDLIIQGISDLYFQWKNNVPERINYLKVVAIEFILEYSMPTKLI